VPTTSPLECLQLVILDQDILALGTACFAETLAQCGNLPALASGIPTLRCATTSIPDCCARGRAAVRRSTAVMNSRRLRLLPVAGWGLHALESAALSRRTLKSDIAPFWTSRKSTEPGAAQFYEAGNMTAPEFRAFDLSPLP
jgi:hypothetical protein